MEKKTVGHAIVMKFKIFRISLSIPCFLMSVNVYRKNSEIPNVEHVDRFRFGQGAYRITKTEIGIKPRVKIQLPQLRIRQPKFSKEYKQQMNFPPGTESQKYIQ